MDFNWLKKLQVSTKDLSLQPMESKTQATAATAGESVTFSLPMDMLLYGIDLMCTADTTGALADKITEVELKLDGSKTIRNLSGNMLKTIATMYGKKPSTGFYPIYIVDAVLDTDPIPLKQFSSCTLKVTVGAAAAGIKNVITPTLQLGARQSYGKLSDFQNGSILVETFLPQAVYGANLGDLMYEHMRSQNVYGYIIETGDADTLADTTFDQYTLKLFSANGVLTPFDHVTLAQLKEWNTQENNGNALPTGVFYIGIPDALKTRDYTNIKSYFHATVAGTNKQVKVLERAKFGGV